jgi:hypothetical protein
MTSDFVIVTTKEGGIGIDFKGTDVAHVILAFEYSNYSEVKQSLGRGSREITKTCTGTLITKEKLPCPIEKLVDLLKADD